MLITLIITKVFNIKIDCIYNAYEIRKLFFLKNVYIQPYNRFIL